MGEWKRWEYSLAKSNFDMSSQQQETTDQQLITNVVSWFIPTVFLTALLTFIIWCFIFFSFSVACRHSGMVLMVGCPAFLPLVKPLSEFVMWKKKLSSQEYEALIRQNLRWAYLYHFIALPLAAFGLLSPRSAIFFLTGSALTVAVNTARVFWNHGSST
mgnify:CR=1 FL=1